MKHHEVSPMAKREASTSAWARDLDLSCGKLVMAPMPDMRRPLVLVYDTCRQGGAGKSTFDQQRKNVRVKSREHSKFKEGGRLQPVEGA